MAVVSVTHHILIKEVPPYINSLCSKAWTYLVEGGGDSFPGVPDGHLLGQKGRIIRATNPFMILNWVIRASFTPSKRIEIRLCFKKQCA